MNNQRFYVMKGFELAVSVMKVALKLQWSLEEDSERRKGKSFDATENVKNWLSEKVRVN
jgi:hypothetical protein